MVTPAGPAEPSAGQDAPGAGLPLLLSLAMAQFMVVLDFTIVNVALPSIQSELHVATTTLQWLVSAYGHRTAVAMLITAGFALAGLLATLVVPPGPPHPGQPQPRHLFRHHAGGIP